MLRRNFIKTSILGTAATLAAGIIQINLKDLNLNKNEHLLINSSNSTFKYYQLTGLGENLVSIIGCNTNWHKTQKILSKELPLLQYLSESHPRNLNFRRGFLQNELLIVQANNINQYPSNGLYFARDDKAPLFLVGGSSIDGVRDIWTRKFSAPLPDIFTT